MGMMKLSIEKSIRLETYLDIDMEWCGDQLMFLVVKGPPRSQISPQSLQFHRQ